MVKSIERLAFLLGFDEEQLLEVSEKADSYYYIKKELKKNEDGSPRFKNGEKVYRILHPSNGILKTIQHRIQKIILRKINFPNYLQGGIKGKSNITNAEVHKGQKYFLCTDLKDFYPSVDFDLVYKTFLDQGFSHDVSHLLTKLTTYKYCLPQGTHTSPYLANLAFLKYDKMLNYKSKKNDLVYTRYVDDITVSGKTNFKKYVPDLLNVIHKSPFQVNHKKTFFKVGPTLVTGVVTRNNQLKAREDQFQKLNSSMLNEIQKKGLELYIEQVEDQ